MRCKLVFSVRCAFLIWPNYSQVTLPSPGNFSRYAAIPYYVVFTTSPRSLSLSREITADATISVSLIRQVTISTPPSSATSPPLTPSSSADDSDSSSSPQVPMSRKLFGRIAKSAPAILSRAPGVPQESTPIMDKPLPLIPSGGFAPFCENRTLHTDVCVGFPKRPRHRQDEPQSNGSLPDGLYKGKIQLNKTMLPGIDWPSVSVKVGPLLLLCFP